MSRRGGTEFQSAGGQGAEFTPAGGTGTAAGCTNGVPASQLETDPDASGTEGAAGIAHCPAAEPWLVSWGCSARMWVLSTVIAETPGSGLFLFLYFLFFP